MSKTLGTLLKKAREVKGVSLREVAKNTDISNPYLSQLENNDDIEPSPHMLHKLAEYYGLKYEGLMEAAGYVVSGQKKKTVSPEVLFLKEQDFSEEEAKMINAFLASYRGQKSIAKEKKDKH